MAKFPMRGLLWGGVGNPSMGSFSFMSWCGIWIMLGGGVCLCCGCFISICGRDSFELPPPPLPSPPLSFSLSSSSRMLSCWPPLISSWDSCAMSGRELDRLRLGGAGRTSGSSSGDLIRLRSEPPTPNTLLGDFNDIVEGTGLSLDVVAAAPPTVVAEGN